MAPKTAQEKQYDAMVKEHKALIKGSLDRLGPDYTYWTIQHRLLDKGVFNPYFVVLVRRIVDRNAPRAKDRYGAVSGEVVDQIQREYAAAAPLHFPLRIRTD